MFVAVKQSTHNSFWITELRAPRLDGELLVERRACEKINQMPPSTQLTDQQHRLTLARAV
jgi:hypothetical protein